MTKALYAVIAVVVGFIVLCAAGGAMLFGGSANSPCTMPIAGISGSANAIGSYDSDQVANATTIVSVGAQLGVPIRGWTIAVAVALQESNLRNETSGNRDSLGLFQQRPSQGWGTAAQLLDPAYVSRKFYQKLLTIPNWQTMSLTDAGQAVQNSAYPDAYAKWEPDATMLVESITNDTLLPPSADPDECYALCPTTSAQSTTPNPESACLAGEQILGRAQTWLYAWNGGPVPYLSSGNPGDWFEGYRRDCSGYASMALDLKGPGLDTASLAAHSTAIAKQELQSGDLLINPAPDLQGHVVIFDHWTDPTMTSYVGYEQSGDGGTHHRTIPYPYFGDYQMSPYRLRMSTLNGG